MSTTTLPERKYQESESAPLAPAAGVGLNKDQIIEEGSCEKLEFIFD